MLRADLVLRRVSPFSLFLMDQKNQSLVKTVPFLERGKMLSEMYRKLSSDEMKKLQLKADKHPSWKRKKVVKKMESLEKINLPTFQEYVQANVSKVEALCPTVRMEALSDMFSLKKPVVIEDSKGMKVVLIPCLRLEKEVKKALQKYDRGEKCVKLGSHNKCSAASTKKSVKGALHKKKVSPNKKKAFKKVLLNRKRTLKKKPLKPILPNPIKKRKTKK